MDYAAIIRDDGITFIIDQRTYKVGVNDKNFDKVKQAHNAKDAKTLKKLLDVAEGLINYSEGSVEITNGVVSWNGKEIHNSLTKRMIRMMQDDYSISSLIAFMDNLMKNPSHTSIQELYMFLDQNDLPITEDGHFVAYKKVRADYKDIYTGEFDNSVGETLSMERNEVDDQRGNTCSVGLHFCSKDYLTSYGANGSGARVMIVKINPQDVVSIPSDYNNAKGRTCRYEVINEWEEWYEKYGVENKLEDTAVYPEKEFDHDGESFNYEKYDDDDRAPVKKDKAGNWRDRYGRFTYAP